MQIKFLSNDSHLKPPLPGFQDFEACYLFFKGERGWVGLGRFKNERCSVLVQLSARENDVTRNDCFL